MTIKGFIEYHDVFSREKILATAVSEYIYIALLQNNEALLRPHCCHLTVMVYIVQDAVVQILFLITTL